MPTWLLKTEPDCYSWADMLADRRTHWDGVASPAAQKHMRAMRPGDEAFFYHTGDEKAVVGLVRVVKGPYPDPERPGTTAAGDPKGVLVDVEPVREAKAPVTLAVIKADPRFEAFDLVRISRLGVMPVPPALDRMLRKVGGL